MEWMERRQVKEEDRQKICCVGTMWLNKERPTCKSESLNKEAEPKPYQALQPHTKV